METTKELHVQIRIEPEEYTQARKALSVLACVVAHASAVTNELPSDALFTLYSRSSLDDDVLERAFDRLDRLVHWLEGWTEWRSARAINDRERLDRLRCTVEAVHEAAIEARSTVRTLMLLPRADTAVSRLLALRIGIAGLIDSRQRVLHDDRPSLQRALERLLEASDWTV